MRAWRALWCGAWHGHRHFDATLYRGGRAAAQTVADAARKVRAALTARVPPECPAAMQWLGDYGRALANTWSAP